LQIKISGAFELGKLWRLLSDIDLVFRELEHSITGEEPTLVYHVVELSISRKEENK